METVDFIDNMESILKRQNVVLSKSSPVGAVGKNYIFRNYSILAVQVNCVVTIEEWVQLSHAVL